MVSVVLLFNIKKGNTASFSRIQIGQKRNDKNGIEILQSQRLLWRDEKTNDHTEQTKVDR